MWARRNLALLPPVGLIGHGRRASRIIPAPDCRQISDHFFYADFPRRRARIRDPAHGASYTVDNPKDVMAGQFAEEHDREAALGLYPSDVEFGSDGGAYVLDWVIGWRRPARAASSACMIPPLMRARWCRRRRS